VFVNGIESAARFTRAIHTIVRNYGSDLVQPGAASLFFVNSSGWALTCKHVVGLLVETDKLSQRRSAFLSEVQALTGEKKMKRSLREAEEKHGFSKGKPFEIHLSFVGCVDQQTPVHFVVHPELDLALIKFERGKVLCDAFPVFAARGDDLKQGKFLCRLGFPFPEFTNYRYDPATNTTSWTQEGRQQSPRFPLEGMVTRHLAGPGGTILGFEMSTPGLRGQSGGPAFDTEGRVWGMQSATNHLDLDFDINVEVIRQGLKQRVKDSAFLHVGQCVHVNPIKTFLRANNVEFMEG
jgi:hypothetical protein